MAVYTEVGDQELARFLADYDVGRLLSYKGIAEGVENTNYLVRTDRGPFILTLYERRVDPADLPFFLGLMEHLAKKGASCPLPVRKRSGDVIGTIGGRSAALVTFLEGVWPRQPTAAHCQGVGRALAELHVAGADFTLTRRNGLGPSDWRPLFDRFAAQADSVTPRLAATIRAELDGFATAWPRDLPAGVIHADLFPDNIFFIDGAVSGVIDFYFACNDLLAYDLAVCLNAWGFDASFQRDPERCAALVEAYTAVRPLSDTEWSALPVLCRGAALRFLLTRAYDWINTPSDALVQRKDPLEYLAKLRAHQQITDGHVYRART
jgi:homoserine kinase type II